MASSINFLAFPPELRHTIYGFTFESATLSIVDTGRTFVDEPSQVKALNFPLALLQTCHSINEEVGTYLDRTFLTSLFVQTRRTYNLQALIPAHIRSRIEVITGHRDANHSIQQLGRAVLPNLKKVSMAIGCTLRVAIDGLERWFPNDAGTVESVTEFMLRFIHCTQWSRQRAMPLLAAGVEVVLTARIGIQDLWLMPDGIVDRQLICRYYDVEVVLGLNGEGTRVVKVVGRIVEKVLAEEVDLLFLEWEAMGGEAGNIHQWVDAPNQWFAADELKQRCARAFEVLASPGRVLKSCGPEVNVD